MIYKFFKKYRVAKVYGGSKLKNLIETRWAGHIKSTVAVCNNYEEIILALEEIRSSTETGHEQEIKFDGDEIATANGIYSIITTQKFLFLAHMFKELLQIFQPVDSLLQSREVGYGAAMLMINSLIEDVKHFRTDEVFNRILSSVTEIREHLELTEPVRRGRPPIASPQDLLKYKFCKCVDVVIKELTARFTENSDILIAASSVEGMDFKSLQPLSKIIKLPEEWELRSAKSYLDRQRQEAEWQNKSIVQIFKPVKIAFPLVYQMLEAVETIGCSTAVNEASFSSLSRVGTINRMSMSNQRLRDLTFLAFESNEVRTVDKMVILRRFDDAKNRRVQLF